MNIVSPLAKYFTSIKSGRWLRLMLLPLIAVALAACGFDEEEELPGPGPERPKPRETVGRAVLVYMVANNSLGSSYLDDGERGFDTADLREMQLAARQGALGSNRLIVYRHAYRTDPVLLEVTPDSLREIKAYDTSEYSVQASRMRRVIADFKAEAPAWHYGLVLWSHGSGWEQTGMAEEEVRRSPLRSFGADGSRQMNVTTLAQVLEGENFDYIYFDCCHMAGVEVAYELRHATDKIVGSVTELPLDGMPYDRTLPYLMTDGADLAGAAAATFGYYDSLTGAARTCTMSVTDTSKLDALAEAVGELYSRHPALHDGYQPQKFIYSNCTYFDLDHYLEALAGEDAELLPLLYKAREAIADAVLYNAHTPYIWESSSFEVEIKNCCGLSTFILRDASAASTKGYSDLQWYRDVASRLYD